MRESLLDVVLLLAVVGLVSGLARRTGLLAPILLVVAGVAFSFVPIGPEIHLEPDLILEGILPLLLYIAAIRTSLPAFRSNLSPIVLLAFGHVLFIAALVGLVLHAVVPSIPLAATFALGAVVAPPDAVAATAIARRLHLPRQVVTILEGESLVNDATALVALRVAVSAALGTTVTWAGAVGQLSLSVFGGLAIGGVVAVLARWMHQRTRDALLDNTISLLTPFVAFVPANYIGASGIVAVVTCGLYLGHRRDRMLDPAARVQIDAVWKVTQFLLEGTLFLLVGLQMRSVVDALSSGWQLVTAATVAVVLTVVIGRFVWVFPGAYLPPALRLDREHHTYPPWPNVVVVSWAGMRGVVTLAAALSLPLDFPGRDLLVFIAFVVILVTLVAQGLTLPAVVRLVGVVRDDPREDLLAEAEVRQDAMRAALARLDTDRGDAPDYVVDRLRDSAEIRANQVWERLGDPDREPPTETMRRLRLGMLDAERGVFVQARDEKRIPEEVLREVERELDLEQLMMARGRQEEDDS
ncbi:monovalent cation:H+ antiporter, CPA1 family [Actinopolymorpha cephalotaxi]|uniref:CPA1 family monovalent cation:H+ antiporter n=1 Tax=Actinopolymorpha cephalotaxi TaxID=504797 RepID=A0A1I2ZFC5_9ACTN|nr:Na+/H+ antiporter [Actinopolymorpha cephalotaxi]NYH81942.1 CPA1 family monovalent cation:H+ antiporter [Actinopolymorpha cephalotaxi]SFH36209.1 monovalent cation:H+ antiporter, CPA1 family [Actinopolymorpha cephalotaxi]